MPNNNLPPNWSLVKLGDVCERITKGSTPTSYGFKYHSKGINFVKTENIDLDGNVFGIQEFINNETNDFLNRSKLKVNDILFSIAGTIGRVGVVKENNLPANTNQALAIIRLLLDSILHKFIYYYLKSPSIQKGALKKIVGVGRANLSLANVADFDIPLPPLPEQKKIVEKIEELFSELDSGVTSFKKAKEEIRLYRQCVLANAFNDKLIGNEKIDEKIGLPDGWKWIKLGELSDLITKGTSPRWQGFQYVYNPEQTLFVTSENVRNNFIDISNPKYLDDSFNQKQKRSILRKGDVLFNLVGASIGRAAVFNFKVKSNINQAVALIRVTTELSNKYLSYFLNSEIAKKKYMNEVVDVARANLSLSDTSNILIPFCNLDNQLQIVSEIEKRFSEADNLEKAIDESLAKAETLRQSILKKAFEGKLV